MQGPLPGLAAPSCAGALPDLSFLDWMASPAYVTDAAGLLVRWNALAAAVWGRDPRALEPGDRSCGSGLRTAPGGSPAEAPLAQVLAGGTPVPASEVIIDRPDGSSVTILLQLTPLRDAHGVVAGALGVMTQVPARPASQAALAAQARQVEVVLDALPACVAYVDREERYQLVSQGSIEWIGRPRQELIGRTIAEIVGQTTYQRLQGHVRAALDGKRVSFQSQVPHKEGIRLCQLDYIPDIAADGTVRGYIVLAQDVTRLQRTERDLATTTEAWRRSQLELEQFAAATSDDLRQPLATIGSLLTHLEHRTDLAGDDATRALARDARAHLQLMEGVIERLLEFAGVGARAHAMDTVDLAALAREVVASLQARFANVQGSVSMDVLPSVRGDRSQLARVVHHLLVHAHHRPSQRPLRVHLSASISGEHAIVAIADNGLAVAPEQQQQYFQPASSPHAAAETLRLAICRRIIEGHGGHIWIESTLGEGTTIRFSLPTEAMPAIAPPPSPLLDWNPEEHWRALFMQAPASIAVFRGPEHVFEFANPRYLEMLGRTTLVGKTVREALPEIQSSGIIEVLDRVYRTGEPYFASEYPVPIRKRLDREPELCYFSFHLHPVRDRSGRIYAQIVVAIEITEQVRARRQLEASAADLLRQRQALAESEARLRELADAMPQIVWMTTADGKALYFNARWYEYSGVHRDADADSAWQQIVHPEDIAAVQSGFGQAVATGMPFEGSFRMRDHRTGVYRWHLGRAVPVRDAAGVIQRWYGTSTDIDAQRQAEAAARANEESLSLAIAATGIGTWDYRPGAETVQWSASKRAMWGLAPDHPIVVADCIAHIHPDDRGAVTSAVDRALQRRDEGRYTCDFRIRRFDNGDERWLTSSGRVFFAPDGKPQRFIGTSQDITQQRLALHRRSFLEATREALAVDAEPAQALLRVAEAAVPQVADWAVVDLVTDDGRRSLVGHVHPDPERRAFARELRRRSPRPSVDPVVQAVAGGRAVLFDDVPAALAATGRTDDLALDLAKLDLRSLVVIPIHLHGRLHATLMLVTAQSARRFSEEDRQFGDELAGVISAALERTALYRDALEAREEAEMLHAVGVSVASEPELEKVVQLITDAGTKATRAEFGAFFYNVLDEAGGRYTLYTISGVPRERFSNFPMPRATDLFAPTFRGEGVIRLANIREDPRFGKAAPHYGPPPGHLPVVSYLAVPVISRSGEVLGGLFFGHPEVGRFTARHERLATGIAAQAAIAIDNGRLLLAEKQARQVSATQAAELQHINSELEQFAYITSHDLQEPLRTITQYLDLLLMRYQAQLDQKAQHYVTIARDGAERMYRLINDLLSYSRSGREALRRETVDLDALVAGVLQNLEQVIQASQARIQVDPLGTVVADPVLLGQALQNLVANALKFHAPGMPPQVEISCADQADSWEISVADHGIGIDPADQHRLFRVFQRLHRQEEFPGTGIGLAIAQKISERHGGRIRLESAAGKGSRFTLLLRKAQAMAKE